LPIGGNCVHLTQIYPIGKFCVIEKFCGQNFRYEKFSDLAANFYKIKKASVASAKFYSSAIGGPLGLRNKGLGEEGGLVNLFHSPAPRTAYFFALGISMDM